MAFLQITYIYRFNGTVLSACVTNPISKGQEICHSYGMLMVSHGIFSYCYQVLRWVREKELNDSRY